MNGIAEVPFAVNGVDAVTGNYLLPPLRLRDLSVIARGGTRDDLVAELKRRHRRATEPVFAAKQGVDPNDLAEAGWGVIFAADADPAVRRALDPLLQRRRDQAARTSESRYREFTGAAGYRAGESKLDFLGRHRSGPGPVDPDVVPYYLLLIGGPEEIPFPVQYQLDIQHAVGRVAFDTVDDYARYAENVLAAEAAAQESGPVRLTFFAPQHDGDEPTDLSVHDLVEPLVQGFGQKPDAWSIEARLRGAATKAGLQALMGAAPDVLFTASHGLGLEAGHPRQPTDQGGLVCSDWPGPGSPVRPADWFGAADLGATQEVDLVGTVAVLFACFGAGTPARDSSGLGSNSARLADASFVSALPKRLLSMERGAVAVIGHVDRAWSYSFRWPQAGRQTEVYRSTLAQLGAGHRVGSALEYLGDRYAEVASELGILLEEARTGRKPNDQLLAGLWTACADARGFVLLGDPAVRLRRTTGTGDRPVSAPGFATIMRGAARDGRGSFGDGATDEVAAPAPTALPASERGAPVDSAPVEVTTYVTKNLDLVGFDAATGRITGATARLMSRVSIEGVATHVVTDVGAAPGALDEVTELHARLLEVSLAVRRARVDGANGSA